MPKKRKHHETCMHCAFMHAFRAKYGKGGGNNPKAFDALARSAAKVAALVMVKLDNAGKGQFMLEVMKRTAEFEGMTIAIEGEKGDFTAAAPGAPAEPTKH
jgi:hypothetical protein